MRVVGRIVMAALAFAVERDIAVSDAEQRTADVAIHRVREEQPRKTVARQHGDEATRRVRSQVDEAAHISQAHQSTPHARHH